LERERETERSNKDLNTHSVNVPMRRERTERFIEEREKRQRKKLKEKETGMVHER
jgi:hypothetical protein